MVGSCVNSNTVRKISDQPTPVLYGGGDDEDDDDDDDDDDDNPARIFHTVHQNVGTKLGTTAYVTTSRGIKLLSSSSSSFVN